MKTYSIRCRLKGQPFAKADHVSIVEANSFLDAIVNQSDRRSLGLTWKEITCLETQEHFTLEQIRYQNIELPKDR